MTYKIGVLIGQSLEIVEFPILNLNTLLLNMLSHPRMYLK
jgi:hypothetical protein